MVLLFFYNPALVGDEKWVFLRELAETGSQVTAAKLKDFSLPAGDYALYDGSKTEIEPGLPRRISFLRKVRIETDTGLTQSVRTIS